MQLSRTNGGNIIMAIMEYWGVKQKVMNKKRHQDINQYTQQKVLQYKKKKSSGCQKKDREEIIKKKQVYKTRAKKNREQPTETKTKEKGKKYVEQCVKKQNQKE